MIGTITPLVQGRKTVGLLTMVTHSLGSILGGTFLGLALGWAGTLLPVAIHGPVALYSLAGLAVLAAAIDFGLIPVRVPSLRWQVPKEWRSRFWPPVTGLFYGFLLALGFTTYVPVAGFYLVVVASALSGRPEWGALLLLSYSVGRLIPVLGASLWAARGRETAEAVMNVLSARGWFRLTSGVLAIATALLFVIGSVHA